LERKKKRKSEYVSEYRSFAVIWKVLFDILNAPTGPSSDTKSVKTAEPGTCNF
jgi:hypothetical protein